MASSNKSGIITPTIHHLPEPPQEKSLPKLSPIPLGLMSQELQRLISYQKIQQQWKIVLSVYNGDRREEAAMASANN